jgi:formylglycine-generating enzyme required for sulfatase activity
MANSLRGYGFTVIERNNLTVKQIGSTLREFRSKLSAGSVALVFYAGHGIQIKGENYLPAVDADIVGEEDVPNQSLSTRQLMDVLADAKSRMNLVFLDACRDNPFARSFRSSSRGLGRENAPSGTLISFATRPGSTAADGDGRNGLYTSVLLQQIKNTDQPIEQVLKKVVSGVKLASKGQQEPWMEGSIEGDFCFGQCGSSIASINLDPTISVSQTDNLSDSEWFNQLPLNGYVISLGAFDIEAQIMSFKRSDANFSQSRILKVQRKDNGKNYFLLLVGPYESKLDAERVMQSNSVLSKGYVRSVKSLKEQSLAIGNKTESPKKIARIYKDCEDCPEIVEIPSGTFLMGSKLDPFSQFGLQSDEQPQHTVSIKSFSIGRYEVTQEQWFSLMGNLPSYSRGRTLPVEQVSWEDTQEYLKRLSLKTGKKYRLPSEAEWEYAARAGSQTAFSYGEDKDLLGQYAWWEENSQKEIHPVGGKLPNSFGLHDMHGNVMEWTNDCWNLNYISAPTDGSAWLEGDCSRRVMRGGSWYHQSTYLRSAYRFGGAASLNFYGFRVARDN